MSRRQWILQKWQRISCFPLRRKVGVDVDGVLRKNLRINCRLSKLIVGCSEAVDVRNKNRCSETNLASSNMVALSIKGTNLVKQRTGGGIRKIRISKNMLMRRKKNHKKRCWYLLEFSQWYLDLKCIKWIM